MSESGRKQNSKWDITEVDMSPEDLHNSARRIKKGSSFHDKDVGWNSSNDHGNNDPSSIAKHDIGMQFRESLSGRRDFQRDESINEKSMLAWDGDGNYTTRMSPGLDDWRQQKRHRSRSHSPKSRARSRRSRSRSRSRSPARKFRRELGSNDQSRRNRSGVSSQSCRDFSSGRCRRGNSCPFLHHESQDYDRRHLESSSINGLESRLRKNGGSRHSSDDPRDYPLSGRSKHSCNDFLKGKCNRGASCKFAHSDNVSNVVGKGPARDVYRDCDPSKSRGPLCKFFSAGNCHDGKHCRFSHHRRETESPETRSLNEISTRLPDHDLDNVSRSRNGSKWSDVDTITEQVENVDVMKPRNTAWSGEDSANHNFVTKSHTSVAPTSWDAPVSIDEKQLFQWKPENIIPDAVVSDMKGMQKCFSDTELLSSNSIVQQQAGKIIRNPESLFLPQTSCPLGQRDMPREVPSDKQYAAGFVQPQIFDNSFFQQKSTFGGDFSPLYPVENMNASGKTPSSHANLNVSTDVFPGHGIDPNFGSQPMSGFHLYPATRLLPPGEGLKMSHNQSVLDNSLTDGMDIGCANSSQSAAAAAPARSTVLDDQLSQASHLSSIAQLLENRQQLSQLYAGVSSLLDSMASVPPASTAAFQAANEADGSKHYDPICDSIEQKTPTANTQFFPNVVDQKLSVHGTLPSPTSAAAPTPSVSGILDSGDLLKAGLPRDELNQQGPVHHQQEPVSASAIEENDRTKDVGTDNPQENGPPENLAMEDGGDDDDDGKKGKDVKGIRPFKFALAEFVKELLKPTWKEGQVSKEVYKTIVKKTVDKVTDTVKGEHVPQTKERIDQYLSFSRPKLSKLVQAYVKRYQKS